MPQPTLVLLVRFRSELPFDEMIKIMNDRAPEFAALPGLLQKYYLQDPASGEVAGLYLWESEEAFNEYRESELRATIAQAYKAAGPPRIEVLRVLKTLRE